MVHLAINNWEKNYWKEVGRDEKTYFKLKGDLLVKICPSIHSTETRCATTTSSTKIGLLELTLDLTRFLIRHLKKALTGYSFKMLVMAADVIGALALKNKMSWVVTTVLQFCGTNGRADIFGWVQYHYGCSDVLVLRYPIFPKPSHSTQNWLSILEVEMPCWHTKKDLALGLFIQSFFGFGESEMWHSSHPQKNEKHLRAGLLVAP